MTQAELAEAIGVTEQFVSLLERGKRSATLETVQALADVFALEAWELLRPGGVEDRRSRADTSSHVKALLEAWPERDQEQLVTLLITLRQVASKKKPARKRPGKRGSSRG